MNIWVIARSTFGETIRKRIGLYVVFSAVVFLILSQLFAQFSTGGVSSEIGGGSRVEVTIIKSMAFFIIVLSGLVLSIFLSFDLVPSDVDNKTIYTILSKPVKRWHYVFGKFIGTCMALLMNIGFMGVALMILVAIKSHQLEWPLLGGVLLLFMQFAVLTGLAILLSLVVTRNINVALCFAFYITGTVSEFWQSIAATSDNPLIKLMVKAIHLVIPNFYNFSFTNTMVHLEKWREIPNAAADVGWAGLYGVLYLAVILLLAFTIFEKKEV